MAAIDGGGMLVTCRAGGGTLVAGSEGGGMFVTGMLGGGMLVMGTWAWWGTMVVCTAMGWPRLEGTAGRGWESGGGG